MPSLLSKLAACGLLAGGFAVTGDLGRLADRGSKLLNATGVPSEQTPDEAGPPPTPPPALSPPTPAVSPLPAAPAPRPSLAPAMPPARGMTADTPPSRPQEPRRLPVSTPASLDVGSLRPGQRLTVWAGSPPAPHAFDIVDPTTGEVLEQTSADGQPGVSQRRLRLEAASSQPTRLDRGGTLRLMPLGVAYGSRPAGPAEMLGPVRALEVK